ncbi:MAG: hypothetical protein HQ539_03570 [Parcubacteria group bacterium]|nr:hypothetical protein [Parcubacteria group bacterium]
MTWTRKFGIFCVAIAIVTLLVVSTVSALDLEPPPGPPSIMWLSHSDESPEEVIKNQKNQILAVVEIYVLQPTYLAAVDLEFDGGKVKKVSMNIGTMIPSSIGGGPFLLIVKGKPSAKKNKQITWRITGVTGFVGGPEGSEVDFVSGLPLQKTVKVVKKRLKH